MPLPILVWPRLDPGGATVDSWGDQSWKRDGHFGERDDGHAWALSSCFSTLAHPGGPSRTSITTPGTPRGFMVGFFIISAPGEGPEMHPMKVLTCGLQPWRGKTTPVPLADLILSTILRTCIRQVKHHRHVYQNEQKEPSGTRPTHRAVAF